MSQAEIGRFESMTIEYLLTEKRQSAKMSFDDVARAAYPDEEIGKARMRLYRLRKPQKSTGAPRKISLEEFASICRALGLNPVQEFAVVLDRFEQGK